MYPLRRRSSIIVNEIESIGINRVFKIPDMYTIFKIKRNPFDGDPRVADWVRQVFECSQMDEKKFKKIEMTTIFASHLYPFCENIHRFENIQKLFLLTFVLDDHTECDWGDVARDGHKAKDVWYQAIDALEKVFDKDNSISMAEWKPYTIFWYEVIEDICKDLNPVSKIRLLDILRDYCNGNIAESDRIENHYDLEDVEEMHNIRRQTIASYLLFELIEYSDDIILTEEEWNDNLFQELLLMGTDAIIYNNDVVSFEKEWVEQSMQLERVYNMVARTAILDKCCIATALEKVADMSMKMEANMMEITKKLEMGEISDNMKSFVERVGYIVGGHFKVGTLLDRYNKIYD